MITSITVAIENTNICKTLFWVLHFGFLEIECHFHGDIGLPIV